MSILKKGWEEYRKDMVPLAARPTQVRETRKAFYEGAAVIIEAIITDILEEKSPQERSYSLTAIIKEMETYTDEQITSMEIDNFVESIENIKNHLPSRN